MAELVGIQMALEQYQNQLRRYQNCAAKLVIFSDSQAAIQAISNPKRSSGQYIIRCIYEAVRALRGSDTGACTTSDTPSPVELCWIPAHVGIPGNEAVDVEAKFAAECGGTDQRIPVADVVRLASSAKRWVRQRLKERWIKEWGKSTDKLSVQYHRLVPVPEKKTLQLYEKFPKAYSSILVQMRSQRVGLRHFLFKYASQRGSGSGENEFNAGRCQCEEGSQTPQHVLLHCPLYTELRASFLNKIMYKTDLGRCSDYNTLISHPVACRYVAEFIHRTGPLGQFHEVEYEDMDIQEAEDMVNNI